MMKKNIRKTYQTKSYKSNTYSDKTRSFGFTLLEVTVVLMILMIALPAAFSIFMTNMRAQSKVVALQDVKRNGDIALSTIESLIKTQAVELETEAGTNVCIESGSEYIPETQDDRIFFVDGEGNRFDFTVTNDRVASNSASTILLTSDEVKVSNLILSCQRESVFTGPLVSISFTIDQAKITTRAEETATLNYSTKVRLRTF